mmetsp:Transcript_14031/g.33159  ORF Transcript_14031/g.33159 Transcript_14031/m.33159 type:complete len:244 (+) Transcript_14031:752-1483(+)
MRVPGTFDSSCFRRLGTGSDATQRWRFWCAIVQITRTHALSLDLTRLFFCRAEKRVHLGVMSPHHDISDGHGACGVFRQWLLLGAKSAPLPTVGSRPPHHLGVFRETVAQIVEAARNVPTVQRQESKRCIVTFWQIGKVGGRVVFEMAREIRDQDVIVYRRVVDTLNVLSVHEAKGCAGLPRNALARDSTTVVKAEPEQWTTSALQTKCALGSIHRDNEEVGFFTPQPDRICGAVGVHPQPSS